MGVRWGAARLYHVKTLLREADQATHLVHDESADPGNDEPICDLPVCPSTRVALPAQRRQRRHAWQVQQYEHHEGEGGKRGETSGREHRGRQTGFARTRGVVEDAHRRDDGFLGDETGEQRDGCGPEPEAKWREDWGDELAEQRENGVLHVDHAETAIEPETREEPDDDGHAEDDGAGAA